MKLCFFECEHEGKKLLGCAQELEGMSSYVGKDLSVWEAMNTEDKINCLNDMIIALAKHHDEKENVKFEDYQRQ